MIIVSPSKIHEDQRLEFISPFLEDRSGGKADFCPKTNGVVPQKCPLNELLDYCICLKTALKLSTCKKVKLFDIDKPMEALSDHQGLLTTWTLKDRH